MDGESTPMNLPHTVLGYTSAIMYIMMAVLLHQIIKQIEKDPETALSQFFLKNTPQKAFKIFALSTLTLVTLFAVEIYAFNFGAQTIANIAIILIILPALGYLYFHYHIYTATRKQQ